jgi:hypothetical protein
VVAPLRKSQPYADSYSDRDCYGYTNSYSDCNCNSYGFAERDTDAIGDPASADAKAAAHAVPTADAVTASEYVKRLKELLALGGVIGNSRGNSRVSLLKRLRAACS